MGGLTPEDKERIEAEERYRGEVRARLAEEAEAFKAKTGAPRPPPVDTGWAELARNAECLEKARKPASKRGALERILSAAVWTLLLVILGFGTLMLLGRSLPDPTEEARRREGDQESRLKAMRAHLRPPQPRSLAQIAAAPRPPPAVPPAPILEAQPSPEPQPTPPPQSDTHFQVETYLAAEELVTAHLKSPATANFPSHLWHSEAWRIERLAEDRARVSSYVDSQNSFGANLRTYFTIEIMKDAGRWVEITFSAQGG